MPANQSNQREERWREIGRKLTKGGAATIGGYLQGGLIGAGASLLREFMRDRRGVELPEAIEDIDLDVVEEEIENMTSEDFIALKRIDADVELKNLEVQAQAQAGFEKRYHAELATGSKWLWMIRPGQTIFWTLVTFAVICIALYGTIPEGREGYFERIFSLCEEITKWTVAFWFSWRGAEKVARIVKGSETPPLTTIVGGVKEIIRRRREKKEKEDA